MLTPEDLEKIAGIVGASEARLGSRIEQIETKLNSVETSVLAAVHTEIVEAEARGREAMEKIETSLLRGFQSWAAPRETQTRLMHERLQEMEREIANLRGRVEKVEGNPFSTN